MGAYYKLPADSPFWCMVHKRVATHVTIKDDYATPCCAPWLGGVMLPCSCIIVKDANDTLVKKENEIFRLNSVISEIKRVLKTV